MLAAAARDPDGLAKIQARLQAFRSNLARGQQQVHANGRRWSVTMLRQAEDDIVLCQERIGEMEEARDQASSVPT